MIFYYEWRFLTDDGLLKQAMLTTGYGTSEDLNYRGPYADQGEAIEAVSEYKERILKMRDKLVLIPVLIPVLVRGADE